MLKKVPVVRYKISSGSLELLEKFCIVYFHEFHMNFLQDFLDKFLDGRELLEKLRKEFLEESEEEEQNSWRNSRNFWTTAKKNFWLQCYILPLTGIDQTCWYACMQAGKTCKSKAQNVAD